MKVSEKKTARGFTLIELLVTIAIVAILIGLLLPAIQKVRESGLRITCANNARQVVLGIHSFESANRFVPPTLSLTQDQPLMHWQASLLPFIEQQPVFAEVTKDFEDSVHVFRHRNFSTTIPILQCPSDPAFGQLVEAMDSKFLFAFTNFCGVSGVDLDESNGLFPTDLDVIKKNRVQFSRVFDGLSNTLAFGERPPSVQENGYGMWLGSQNSQAASIGVAEGNSLSGDFCSNVQFQAPNKEDTRCLIYHHWSFHDSGSNFARVDGSVHFVSYSIDNEVIRALATIAGGESNTSQ